MNVAELKILIEHLPDDMPIMIEHRDGRHLVPGKPYPVANAIRHTVPDCLALTSRT